MYKLSVMFKEELCAEITVDGNNITEVDYTTDWWKLPFGNVKKEVITQKDLEEYYEERCFPRERENCKEILHTMGLPSYEPESICRITHGLQFDDFTWLQFSDEKQVTYEEIKLR